MARKQQRSAGEPPIPEAARPAYEAVVGLIDDLDDARRAENRPQVSAHHRLVVDDHHPDHL